MADARHPDHHDTTDPKLGERFNRALVYVARLHRTQIRKSTRDVPYLSHLMSVAALVLEADGDEDLAIAALLHDTPEDRGGRMALEEIGRLFGARVQHVVDGCTDTYEDPKPDWYTRKRNYIAHLREKADLDTCLVSAADKVHNARSIVTDYRLVGDSVFDRFKASKDATLWYYRELVEALQAAIRRLNVNHEGEYGLPRLLAELGHAVEELERLAGRTREAPCRE